MTSRYVYLRSKDWFFNIGFSNFQAGFISFYKRLNSSIFYSLPEYASQKGPQKGIKLMFSFFLNVVLFSACCSRLKLAWFMLNYLKFINELLNNFSFKIISFLTLIDTKFFDSVIIDYSLQTYQLIISKV